MSELAKFQDAFAKALRGDDALPGQRDVAAVAAGLRVYRNTTFKGMVDALAANFPTVRRLVGEDWFADCARLYAASSPPAIPPLLAYGEDFPSFLARFPSAAELAYLPDVALLDRLWSETHAAADGVALDGEAASTLGPERLFGLRLGLHPAARFAWSQTPAATIWRLNRPPAEPTGEELQIEWRGEGMLLTRPHGEVLSMVLDRPAFEFLDAVDQGAPLGEAAQIALSVDPAFDLGARFAEFISHGAFARPHDLL
ncbi:putative DNA-binding domain-containing protein [Phenylobacterium sp.]|uniref:HvfC/BufC family peptide modification chaperone n=1 Tax=Phenylobacterium sp. TaxID=1871053 RepID=UPI0035AEF791